MVAFMLWRMYDYHCVQIFQHVTDRACKLSESLLQSDQLPEPAVKEEKHSYCMTSHLGVAELVWLVRFLPDHFLIMWL